MSAWIRVEGKRPYYRLAQPPSNAADQRESAASKSVPSGNATSDVATDLLGKTQQPDSHPLNPAQRLLSAMGLRFRLYGTEPVARAAKGELPISAFNEWRKL